MNFALFKRGKLVLPRSCAGLCGEELKAELAMYRSKQSRNSKHRNR